MPAEHKIEAVDRLKEKLERSTIVISADPTGMSVTDMTAFRRALRESDVESQHPDHLQMLRNTSPHQDALTNHKTNRTSL